MGKQKLLWLDGCVRGKQSRTARLAEKLLEELVKRGDYEVEKLVLQNEPDVKPMDGETLEHRTQLQLKGQLDDSFFRYAHQFADADVILLAASYWDLAFPAVVKAYVERVCVEGITFEYGADGQIQGMCKASKLFYVTTCGGYIGNCNLGYEYIQGVCHGLWGIPQQYFLAAEGLDIKGNQPDEIVREAMKKIPALLDESEKTL